MKLEATTSQIRDNLDKFVSFSDYRLAGGTGLAMQLGHRVSIDLDFFKDGHNTEDALFRLKKAFDEEPKIEVSRSDQVMVLISGMKVSFIDDSSPVLFEPISYNGIKVLQAKEILAMKAYTIGRRATLKDYVDIYYGMELGITDIKEMSDLAKRKYGDRFDKRLFLEQLSYLDDVQEGKIEFLIDSVEKSELSRYFEKKINKIRI